MMRKLSLYLFYTLLVLLPFGTRYIFQMGELSGVQVEWGTVSVFSTQLIALACVVSAAITAVHMKLLPVLQNRLYFFALAIAAYSSLSTLWSIDTAAAAMQSAWVVLGVSLFGAITVLRPDVKKSLWLLSGAATVQALIAATQIFTQKVSASTILGVAGHLPSELGAFVIETMDGRWLRAYGTLSHPNILGAILFVGLLAGMMIITKGKMESKAKILLYVMVSVIAMGSVFTFSRSAWMAVMVGFSFFVSMTVRYKRVSNKVFMPLLAAIIFAAMAVAIPSTELMQARIGVTTRLEVQSVEERQNQAGEAMNLIIQHPFRGHGIGQMPVTLAVQDGFQKMGWDYMPVHNILLLVIVELGVIGAGLLLTFMYYLAHCVVRNEKTTITFGLASMLLGLFAAGMFDHYLWSLWIGQALFWIIAGLLYVSTESSLNSVE